MLCRFGGCCCRHPRCTRCDGNIFIRNAVCVCTGLFVPPHYITFYIIHEENKYKYSAVYTFICPQLSCVLYITTLYVSIVYCIWMSVVQWIQIAPSSAIIHPNEQTHFHISTFLVTSSRTAKCTPGHPLSGGPNCEPHTLFIFHSSRTVICSALIPIDYKLSN